MAPPRARAPKSPAEALSRALARTLRHQAKAQGIPQDEAGWCRIDDLLSRSPYNNMNATKQGIFEAVANDNKGRYELNEDRDKIRAVQGHSVDVDVGLRKLSEDELPSILVHGTYFPAWEKIKISGLSKMGRQYIHMASGLPGESGVISGMRSSSEVYIYVDGPGAMKAGISFFSAKNGALLSTGINGVIPPKYFARVTDSKGVVLYP